nr:PAAR domain-containing protein [Roseospira goensis]
MTDPHVCPLHGGGPIVMPCMPTVLIGGLPAARITDVAFCGPIPDPIVRGSATVLTGNLMQARMLDSHSHGGFIAMGCPTVLVGG